jgi:hypothetical protein
MIGPEINIDASLADPQVTALIGVNEAISTGADDFHVITESDYVVAAEQLKRIKRNRDELETRRLAITRRMDEAKKAVMDFFRPFSDRLDRAEDQVKSAMIGYTTAQRRIADEKARQERELADREAARLRELARVADEKAAIKERERLVQEQNAARKRSAEAQCRIDAERAAATTKAEKKRVEEQAAAEIAREEAEQCRLHNERLAAEAAQRERTAKAENLEARAQAVTTAPLAPAIPKVAGISSRETWRYTITDAAQIPDEYWIVDEKAIAAVVKALKGKTSIAGVRVYAETGIAAGKA